MEIAGFHVTPSGMAGGGVSSTRAQEHLDSIKTEGLQSYHRLGLDWIGLSSLAAKCTLKQALPLPRIQSSKARYALQHSLLNAIAVGYR